jgi:hypothetical protein
MKNHFKLFSLGNAKEILIHWIDIPHLDKIFLKVILNLKGQSHEKVDEIRVWGGSLGPN